jgi:transcriptional regulator with XRE-family HTH domain
LSELEKVAAKRMRMLRLNAGWSAEQLSRRYEAAGGGYLPRTTIAKIESDKRAIKASEVDGVARVFGLTSEDLLDRDGPRVILSYAEHDRGTGREVAAWLGDHGFQAITADPPTAGDLRPGSGDPYGIDTAQAFVVLLSPSFLSSSWCQDELARASRRQQLLSAGHAAAFIHVLRVAETPDLGGSGLEAYRPVDLKPDNEKARDAALSRLGGSILSGARTTAAPAAPAEPQAHAPTGQDLLDRAEELHRVFNAVSSLAGPHFWLVISPPRLGKSRFLEQLAAKFDESPAMSWTIRTIDLRHGEPRREYDALTVVRDLLGLKKPQATPDGPPPPTPDDELRGVAQQITRSGQSWLCLLDSAELLSPEAVTQVRQYLGKVYRLIQERNADARLAFVVASRRDDRWKGVTPYPGLSVLPLGGFGAAAVQDALERLARDMPHVGRSPTELRDDAALIQRVTEGVPELVLRSLQWIQREDWFEISRLEEQPQLSDEISLRYIQDKLLAPGSLFPGEEGELSGPTKQLDVLREALRTLVPFRLFTRYHLEQLNRSSTFETAMKDANWEFDDLWQAIAGMALLRRPLDEPWQELHPVVRRLLYRHFYPAAHRADVHRRARDFSKDWAEKLSGKEQIVGMVEAIWHETARLRSEGTVTVGDGNLTSFARELSLKIKPFPYSEAELRDYAAERIRNDDELRREVAGPEDIFEKLVVAIVEPKSA